MVNTKIVDQRRDHLLPSPLAISHFAFAQQTNVSCLVCPRRAACLLHRTRDPLEATRLGRILSRWQTVRLVEHLRRALCRAAGRACSCSPINSAVAGYTSTNSWPFSGSGVVVFESAPVGNGAAARDPDWSNDAASELISWTMS